MPEQVAVRERPLLFSWLMVRAILAGKKTQTRRVITPQPLVSQDPGDPNPAWEWRGRNGDIRETCGGVAHLPGALARHCPYGKPGDRLWVRESGWLMDGRFFAYAATPEFAMQGDTSPPQVLHDPAMNASQARARPEQWRPTPSIHMPRWASRITLEVTGVRVERVQDIDDAGVLAEGTCIRHHFSEHVRDCHGGNDETPVRCFAQAWDGINGKRGFGWSANPWVWVVSFKVVQP